MNPKDKPFANADPSLTDLMRQKLGEVCPEDPEGRIWAELIVEDTMKLAAEGDATALHQLCGRLGPAELKKIEEILLRKGEGMSHDSSELIEGKLVEKP